MPKITPEQRAQILATIPEGQRAQMSQKMDDAEYNAKEKERQDSVINMQIDRPEFLSGYDKGSGLLQDKYQQKGPGSNIGELDRRMGDIQLNTQGLEAIRGKALATGPSAWAQMATQKQQQEESQQRGQSAQQGAAAQAQARSQLAMRGGLSGGARQRLAMQGARDQAQAGQQIGAQGQSARAGIGLQDEQTKNQMLSQLPGQELAALQPAMQKASAWQQMAQGEQGQAIQREQFNTTAALQQQQNQNQANMGLYQEQMKSQASERQARATENAGKK